MVILNKTSIFAYRHNDYVGDNYQHYSINTTITMKKFLSLIAVFILIGTLCGNSITNRVPAYYVEGYYFDKSPQNLPGDYCMSFTSYGDGKKLVLLIYSEPVTLSDEIIAEAIPEDQIADLEYLRTVTMNSLNFHAISNEAYKNREWLNVGTAFPSFTATDIDGVECGSKDIEGKVMVLNLWYTGCGPCRREMPELSTWREKYPDVVFLSSTWESPEVARPVLEKCGFTWRHIVNDRQFLKWLNGRGYPMTIVVDRKGIVRHYENGTNQDKLTGILQAIEAACNAED